MSASGVQGWPLAGIAQTRTVAPASGIPRELKTMSSLREPCACAGPIAPGHTCNASAASAQRNDIVLARLKRDAIFDRIMQLPQRNGGLNGPRVLQQLAGGDGDLDDIGGNAGGVRASGDFRAAAAEGFQLPVVQRGSRNRHRITGVALLAFGEALDKLRSPQISADFLKIQPSP